ncbi:MAG: beta-phosphoglucomutase [Phycisphaerales bacterium]|nr:beta-phosphoglucomutase [Phycisphaerales bacterium]
MYAVIFDLDGVIVSTDELHYSAWKVIADAAGIPFDRTINQRLRGVSRERSLEIVLEGARRAFSERERASLCAQKNQLYVRSLQTLGPQSLLRGVARLLDELRGAGIRCAIASSSRNAATIVDRLELNECFAAVVGGGNVARTKPAPDLMLEAARLLGGAPGDCVVIEDAASGIAAAHAAGMAVVGVGQSEELRCADLVVESLEHLGVPELVRLAPARPTPAR